MTRRATLTLLAAALLTTTADADPPARFAWKEGQVLAYKVEQTTIATETALDEQKKPETTSTTTKLSCVKRWKVLGVDAAGVATVELSLASLRLESQRPGAEPVVFDSAKPESAADQKEMANVVGRPLAVLRVGPLGQVVEVKEGHSGSKGRYETELPFKILLAANAGEKGAAWHRDFTIKLDPPQGTGETHACQQTFTHKNVADGLLVVAMTTTLKQPPPDANELLPLLPFLMEGDLYFHPATGRYYAARLKVTKEITDHQGEGSKYTFQTVYVEDVVEAK